MSSNETIHRFIRALAASDEVSAEQMCTPQSWHAPANSMYQLFRQLRGQGRQSILRIDGTPRVSESPRGAIECSVVGPEGEARSTLTLVYDHIPSRLAGWTRSRVLVERYLAGTVPADIGLHSLADDPGMTDAAHELINDLVKASLGSEDARRRLEESCSSAGAAPEVLAHMHLRLAAGYLVRIEHVYHLPVLDRVVVRLFFPPNPRRRGEESWLYGERDHAGRVRWFALGALFDMDILLSTAPLEH